MSRMTQIKKAFYAFFSVLYRKFYKSIRVIRVCGVSQLNLQKNEKQRDDSTKTTFSFY